MENRPAPPLPFRRKHRLSYRTVLTWGLSAASLLIIAFAGKRACRPSAPVTDYPLELLSAASAFPPPPEALPPSTPLAPLLAADEPDRLAVLSPEETALNLSRGTPLELRFNRPMVESTSLGKPLTDYPVRLKPEVPTTQTWTSRSLLRIEAAATVWEQTRLTTLTLSPTLRSLAGEAVEEFEPRTVVFDASPRYHGRRSERLVAGEPARLFFEGNLSPVDLASKMLVYEIDGGRRMVPFSLAVQPRDDKGHVPLDLRPSRPLEPGGRFAVALAPLLSRGGAHPRVLEFEFAPRPRVEGIQCPPDSSEASHCRYQQPPSHIIDIEESLALIASTELKSVDATAVEISPPLTGLQVTLEGDRRIQVRANWSPGQVYQLRLRNLVDKEGHTLARLAPLALRSEGRTPEVSVATGRLTFERSAPPSLAFRAIHVEEGHLRWSPVPQGKELEAFLQPQSLLGDSLPQAWRSIPLPALVPEARPNRWGRGLFPWIARDPSHSSLAVFRFLPSKNEPPSEPPRTTFAQWTDLGLDVQILREGVSVWVTSLDRATAVQGAFVEVTEDTGTALGSASTDSAGLAWIPAQEQAFPKGAVVRAIHGEDRALLFVDPRASIGPRHFVSKGESTRSNDSLVAALFTDRGLCRPGETIHVKALVRTPGAQPKAVTSGALEFRLLGPGTEAPLAKQTVPLNSFGAAAADFTLAASQEPGAYRIEALREAESLPIIGETEFRVGEYRPPVFRLELQSQAEQVLEAEPLSVALSAVYPFGAPAAGARTQWTLTRSSGGRPIPDKWTKYSFVSVDASLRSGNIDSGSLTLSPQGQAIITTSVSLGAPLRQSVLLEATVQDHSGQSTTARKTFEAFPASWEVGLRELPDWLENGATLDLEAIVLANDGTPKPGVTVEARILREGWHSWWQWSSRAHRNEEEEDSPGTYQLRKDKDRKVVKECKLTSSTEPIHCTFRPERPGTYLLEAAVRDDKGRSSLSSQRVYLAGPEEHPDRDAPGTALSLTPAKADYQVGEIAELAFESPFPTSQALLRVERQRLLHTQTLSAATGGNTIRFEITPEMVPNVYLSLALVRPRTGTPGDKIDLNAPDLRVGSSSLTVRPSLSPLKVELVLPEGRARAGTDLPIQVVVKDSEGKALAAEVALYAVDEGTLRLTNYQIPRLGEMFFPSVSASFSWEDLRRSLVSRLDYGLPAPAGGDGSTTQDKTLSELRERFDPTPLWSPSLQADAEGIARATLHLPPRPTEYRVLAVASDKGARSGQAEQRIVSSRKVVARPVLPHFVTEGDRFEAVVFLHNTTDRELTASLSTRLKGQPGQTRSTTLGPGKEERIAEPINLAKGRSVSLGFRVEAEGETEEIQREIPIEPRGRTLRSELIGKVAADRAVPLNLPRSEGGSSQAVSVTIASHPFVGFELAAQTLDSSRWEGVEPLASSLLAWVAFAKLDKGRRASTLSEQEVQARGEKAIQRLLALQSSSGGFGRYAEQDNPDPYLSVYALQALQEAKRIGWEVKGEAIDKATNWVQAQARSTSYLDTREDRGRDDLAHALHVLALVAAADSGRIQALYDQRQTLSPIGLSHLALAMSRSDRRRDTLVYEAVRRVLATREEEAREPSLLRWYDSSARTLGVVLEAASSLEPIPPEASKLAAKLLQQRSTHPQGPSWWSSKETSHALTGLAAYAERFKTLEPLQVTLQLDGQKIAPQRHNKDQYWFSIPREKVEGSHSLQMNADGPAFFALSAQWTVPLGPEDDTARGKNVALHRILESETGAPLGPDSHVKLGELVRVRLFVYADRERAPSAILRDRFGGGFESLDASLDTTPQQSLAALLGLEDGDDTIDARGFHASRSLNDVAHRAFGERDTTYYISVADRALQEFTYGLRAATPGSFAFPPAELEALYVPGFVARSNATTLTVDP